MGSKRSLWIGLIIFALIAASCGRVVEQSEFFACGERIVLADDFTATDFGDLLGLSGPAVHLSSPATADNPLGLSLSDLYLELPDEVTSSDFGQRFEEWTRRVDADPDNVALLGDTFDIGGCQISFDFTSPATRVNSPHPDDFWVTSLGFTASEAIEAK